MKIRMLLPLLALCCFSGCIEFARQTMSYGYGKAADTLLIFQDYQGIFGATNDSALESEEKLQLASVMKGGRTFFFNNWITEYNRSTTEELLAKPKGEIDSNPEFEAAARALAELALANIKVENVGFYKNKEGQLCGAQRVTVRNCSKVVDALNRLLPYLLREQAGEEGKTSGDKRMLTDFASSGERMLRLDGNQIEIRFPLNNADFESLNQSPHAKGIRAAGGSISHKGDITIITLGTPEGKNISVTMPFSEKSYVPNMLGEVGSQSIKTDFDPQAAAAEFLSGGSAKKP